MREVPEDYRKAKVTAIFTKGKEENPGQERGPRELQAIPGKVMEQTVL